MKNKNSNKGITLIALIITIILMLILAGVVLSLTLSDNGLIKVSIQTSKKTREEEAKEKLQIVLEDLRIQKYSNEEYNETEYIDKYLKNNEMSINDNVVNINGYTFFINRYTLEILDNIENQETEKVFTYTGDIEKYIIERSGKYKLEVWGAAGGGSNGGKGGYSTGEINFQKGDEIYICVGEKGGRNQGGYNGGGSGTYVAGSVKNAGYGGRRSDTYCYN